MKASLRSVGLCLLALSCAVTPIISQTPQSDVEVAVLGIFHFGSTSDLASIKFDDIQSDKRQAEILEVVDLLSNYKPDKVLLEYSYSNRAALQENYELYLKGEYELKVNERELIGFRLARKLGHDSVYAIDQKLDLPFEPVVMYCQENDKMEAFNDFIATVQSFTAGETQKLSGTTLPKYLSQMNTIEYDQLSNDLYLNATANFGEPGSEVGIDAAAAWYKRNMLILKNIDRVTKPGDKSLLIIGQAHRAVLRDFIEDRQDMTFYEIQEVLWDN